MSPPAHDLANSSTGVPRLNKDPIGLYMIANCRHKCVDESNGVGLMGGEDGF